jgi:hypothetical protein
MSHRGGCAGQRPVTGEAREAGAPAGNPRRPAAADPQAGTRRTAQESGTPDAPRYQEVAVTSDSPMNRTDPGRGLSNAMRPDFRYARTH